MNNLSIQYLTDRQSNPNAVGASHVGMSINTHKALWAEKGEHR